MGNVVPVLPRLLPLGVSGPVLRTVACFRLRLPLLLEHMRDVVDGLGGTVGVAVGVAVGGGGGGGGPWEERRKQGRNSFINNVDKIQLEFSPSPPPVNRSSINYSNREAPLYSTSPKVTRSWAHPLIRAGE